MVWTTARARTSQMSRVGRVRKAHGESPGGLLAADQDDILAAKLRRRKSPQEGRRIPRKGGPQPFHPRVHRVRQSKLQLFSYSLRQRAGTLQSFSLTREVTLG